jgi:hypothetical protein
VCYLHLRYWPSFNTRFVSFTQSAGEVDKIFKLIMDVKFSVLDDSWYLTRVSFKIIINLLAVCNFMRRTSRKSGALTYRIPMGLFRPVAGQLYF